MKNFSKYAINYLAFLIAFIFLGAFQTSLWMQLFGWFPAPYLWLTLLVFWVLNRDLWETIVMTYIIAAGAQGFTVIPFAHMLAICLLTVTAILVVKRRVYWEGSTFFMLASGAAVISFLIFSLLISWRYDQNHIQDITAFDWIITPLLTMFFSLPLHRLYMLLDRVTDKDRPTEGGIGII